MAEPLHIAVDLGAGTGGRFASFAEAGNLRLPEIRPRPSGAAEEMARRYRRSNHGTWGRWLPDLEGVAVAVGGGIGQF